LITAHYKYGVKLVCRRLVVHLTFKLRPSVWWTI